MNKNIKHLSILLFSFLTFSLLLAKSLPIYAATTTTFQVKSATDNANEDGTKFSTSGKTVWVGNGASTSNSFIGLRFNNVTIPNGVTITSAKVNLYSSQSQWINVSISSAAEATSSSVSFSSSNRPSNRLLTFTKINSSTNTKWNNNTWYALDEIAPVIQEVVNQTNWQSGNSLSIIIKGTGGSYGRKIATSYSGSTANAPKLVVTYENTNPTVSPTSTVTPTPTVQSTPTPTSLPTPTSTSTPTPTVQPTFTPTSTPIVTITPTPITSTTITSMQIGVGGSDVIPHQIIRTLDDRVYVFGYSGDGSSTLNVHWTSNTGLPISSSDFNNHIQVVQPANIISVSPTYDGNNIVHVLLNLQDGTIRDVPFNTLTNTFLATKILSSGNPVVSGGYVGTSGISSLISSQGTLHIAYWSPDNHITYAGYSYDIQSDILTQISGSTQLDGFESSNNNHPSLAISPVDGTITVVWVSGTDGVGNIWSRSTDTLGVWGNAEKVNTSAVWTSPNSGINIDQGPSLIVTADGIKHLVYIQNWTAEAPYNYGKIHYVTNAGNGWLDQYIGAYTHNPALALNAAGNLVIIGHGMLENQTCKDLDTVCYWQKVSDTSWSEYILLPASTSATFDSSPSVKWSVVGWNRPESIEAIVPNVKNGYTNSSLYYIRIDMVVPTPSVAPTSTPMLTATPTYTPTPTVEPTLTPALTPIPTPTSQITPTPSSTTTTYTISSNDRDAWSGDAHSGNLAHEVRISGYNTTNEQTEFVSNDADSESSAMEFALTVPNSAAIENAYLSVKAGAFQNTSPTGAMEIHVYDTGNALPFTNGFFGDLLTHQPTYPATVMWPSNAIWTNGSIYKTPNIASLVQTIVNRSDYVQNNYIGFVITEGTIISGSYYGWNDFASGDTPAQLTVTYSSNTPLPSSTPTPTLPAATATPIPPTATLTPTPTPVGPTPTSGPLSSEWTQHAFNAEHTSYNPTSIPTPWRWKWSWNGPNTTGGISTGKTMLPRNVQPVTGGGNVYVARGASGVIALNSTNGSVVWSVSPGGNINSTVAYDNDTSSVFAVSSNGTLYKLDAANGVTLSSFSSSGTSSLPLPPSVYENNVFFSMGSYVYAINKNTMQQIWSYNADSLVDTPPAYSSTRNSIIVGSEDLYVHAIDNINGTQLWRVKPSVRSAGNPDSSSSNNLAEFKRGWPVIAEVHGYVLMKARLDWQTLWDMYTGSPDDNTFIRNMLTQNPDQQALFVLDLDNGTVPFIANAGHGGYGNGGYMPMGYQPVVKQYDNGQELAYIIARGFAVGDSRWDSHFAELVLDSTSVPGYSAGYYRYIDYTGGTTNSKGDTFLTDEQPFLSMAGNDLFGNHWEATMHSTRITDRSNTLGIYTNPIKSQQLPTMIESQDGGDCNNTTHFKTGLLQNTRTYPNAPGGFYIYCGLGTIYDQYWSEYATTIVSNNLLIVRSIDGAIVALENATP